MTMKEKTPMSDAFAFERGFAERIKADPQLAFLPELFERFPKSEWYLVGGSVRDFLLQRGEQKDFDFVVRNVALQELEDVLSKMGSVALAGRNFGVLKFVPEGGEEIDIAWPRTERAGGSGGYRDFEVQADPELPIESDLARRDFTMNAVAWDIRNQRFIDPFGGRGDIERKIIKAVGEPAERFAEDYSRMLRALRFACQLGFAFDSATWEGITRHMEHIDDVRPKKGAPGESERVVPYETVGKEWIKAASADPVKCLDLYERSGALFRLMPELEWLAACEQSPDHHSEGDVWTHTKLAVSKLASPEFAAMFPGERASAETFFAVLLHDVAKPATAARQGAAITFYGHEEKGAPVAKHIAERLHFSNYKGGGVSPERLDWLVKMHLFPHVVNLAEVKRTTLMKYFFKDPLAGRELLHLAFADASASLPDGGAPQLETLKGLLPLLAEIAKQFEGKLAQPPKLVSGEDIMEATGAVPGPEIGRILEAVREGQLRGEINTREDAMILLLKLGRK